MQKRFSPRDYLLFAVLGLILLVLLLTMYMIDRQWMKMSEMEQRMNAQADDMRGMRKSLRQISKGQIVQSSSSPLRSDLPASFQRAYDATQLPGYSDGDWLVQSTSANIKSLTPFVSTDVFASDVQSMVQEKLLTYDPDTLELIGHIASSWTISDDGLIITYKMRDDVTFSDGVKLTAHDLEFTFKFVMTEAIEAPRERSYYRKIKSVKALDDYTVQFVFKEPYFNSLLQSGFMDILPEHFYGKYLKDPKAFNESKGILLGSGPYKLVDPVNWTPDKKLVELVRNDRYWGPVTPTYDRLLWKVIENDSARLTTFRNREIDTYAARPIEYTKLLNDKQLMSRVYNFEYMPPINAYFYLGWNEMRDGKKTMFDDKRVRQAMTYLTDRKKIIDEIYLGYGEIAISPFNPQSQQHDKSLVARDYDLEKGKALLKAAGYEDRNGDGVVETANGEKLEFELAFPNNNEDYKRLSLLLKDLYARAGVVLKPRPTEWPVLLEKAKKRTFDVMLIGWSSVVESDLYQIFHSSQIKDEADNFISYSNPQLDQCIEKARSTVVRDKRMPIWHECEKILYEDQPYTFLFRRTALRFVDKRFKNLKVTNFGLNLDMVPFETFVPEKDQKYSN